MTEAPGTHEQMRGVAVICTAIDLEYEAGRAHLIEPIEIHRERGTVYEVGTFPTVRGHWRVVLVRTGPGNSVAGVALERAIATFAPQVVFFVGVAGGRKDVALGDVVVGDVIYDYESGKDAGNGFLPRIKTNAPSHALVQLAGFVARRGRWQQRIRPGCPKRIPTAVVKPIATGGKVVASSGSAIAKLLDQNCGDAVAVEMEGNGFLHGAYVNNRVDALVVRGISDLLSGKTENADARWQPVAAAHAAAFAYELLTHHGLESPSVAFRPKAMQPVDNLNPSTAAKLVAPALTMRRDIGTFVGRELEFQLLAQFASIHGEAISISSSNICIIDGMAGVGKTAFAIHASHKLATQFPDGQLFIPLHGHTSGQIPVSPEDALASLLLATGTDADSMPADVDSRAALWRSKMAGKSAIILLDDVSSHDQVRNLLPASKSCLVIITSRRRLEAIEDARAIAMKTLPTDEAMSLFIRISGTKEDNTDAVRELVRLCGHLPLAITLLAGRLRHHPSWTLPYLVTKVSATVDRLTHLRAENVAVETAFDLSYRNLPLDMRKTFRNLGIHIGDDFDAYSTAALDGAELAKVENDLESLHADHLIEEIAPGRYRFHDLIRDFARNLVPTAERAPIIDRLINYYIYVANLASEKLPGSDPDPKLPGTGLRFQHSDMSSELLAKEWMNRESVNLASCFNYAANHDRPRQALLLFSSFGSHMRLHGPWQQALDIHRTANVIYLALGDQPGQVEVLYHLGLMHRLVGDYPAATDALARAYAIYVDLDDRLGQAHTLNRLGVVQQLTGDYPSATSTLTNAYATYVDLNELPGQAHTLMHLGLAPRLSGDYPAATDALARAYAIYVDLDDRLGQAHTLNRLGVVQQLTSDLGAATDTLAEAHAIYVDLGHRLGQANALKNLGRVQHALGDLGAATDTLAEAHAIYLAIGDRLGQANALNCQGRLSLSRSFYEEAMKFHGKALTQAREIGALLETARASEGMGRCLIQEGDPYRGRKFLNEALRMYRNLGSSEAGNLAKFYFDQQWSSDITPSAGADPQFVKPEIADE
ncbi:hypothetical protein DMH01_41465 [Amycolatopsis sp. WAC 04182]|uniref:tetratricopeptide repeat protein n=1 Tax=Amycolatopsis sp. WAC 04182 TaxID=2203198 RepID=UPI000F7B5FB7|nr:tetratricopeptide repeat protein [Amycolatopsis sp. WAC 04182]RSN52643.1 hypothetical protein DMH01_41465 [Amycolatopsis sp. WAC 04182]